MLGLQNDYLNLNGSLEEAAQEFSELATRNVNMTKDIPTGDDQDYNLYPLNPEFHREMQEKAAKINFTSQVVIFKHSKVWNV